MNRLAGCLAAFVKGWLPQIWPSLWKGGVLYILSSLPVVLGVVCGFASLEPGRPVPYGEDSLLLRFAAWDGGQFMTVMDHGYSFEPERISNIVVFPGYPLTAKLVQYATGVSSAAALLLVSNVCLFLTFVVLHNYLRFRFPEQDDLIDWSLTAFAFFPTTFFFRMAYSESPFLLITVTLLLGVERKWRMPWLCLLVGLATGFRLVGIVLILPLLVSCVDWRSICRRQFLWTCVYLPICFWGLLGLMLFHYLKFGDGFAFSQGQVNYCLRAPVSRVDHYYRLVSLEPIWGTYVADSSAYWKHHSNSPPAILNLQFANPFFL